MENRSGSISGEFLMDKVSWKAQGVIMEEQRVRAQEGRDNATVA
jgi:hypothetical protein